MLSILGTCSRSEWLQSMAPREHDGFIVWASATKCAVLLGAIVFALLGRPVGGQALPSVASLLDEYRGGAFDTAVARLSSEPDAERVRTALVRGAESWIASEPSDLTNRRLVAASFVLEVAHARLRHDNPATIVLLDWATRELRRAPPTATERQWIAAAVALVERGSHDGFSLALSKVGGGFRWGQTFIDRGLRRFPDEPRLRLAQVVWRVSHGRSSGVRRDLERLTQDPVVGADALLQLAYLHVASRDFETAIGVARQAADATAQPATRYAAAFMSGVCYEALRRPGDAMVAYQAALEAVPHGQSASLALAQLLLRSNQADQAFELLDRSLAERPDGDDPWRLFSYGGYIHWAALIADLRTVMP
jgi:tetratricopeptide (TPR) repeat protein